MPATYRHRNHYRRHHHRQMVNHPYAVITASNEKTASRMTICVTTPRNWRSLYRGRNHDRGFPAVMQFGCCFEQQEYSPEQHNQSRPEKEKSMTVNSGLVSVTIMKSATAAPDA